MELDKYIDNISSSVADWLKFAEAKNCALIVLIISSIAIIFDLPTELSIIKIVPVVLCVISLIVSLYSFFPQSHLEPRHGANLDKINIFYYKELSYLSSQEYLDMITNNFDNVEANDLLSMQINEILDNSRIAVRKGDLFSKALILYIVAIGVGIFGFVCAIIINQLISPSATNCIQNLKEYILISF